MRWTLLLPMMKMLCFNVYPSVNVAKRVNRANSEADAKFVFGRSSCVFLPAFMSLQVLHHLWLAKGHTTTQRSSYRDVRHLRLCDPLSFYFGQFAFFPASCARHLPNHTLPVTCYDINSLTFVAGGSRVSLLVFCTHAGSLCASSNSSNLPLLLLGNKSFSMRFPLISGVALSLQCIQVTFVPGP